MARDDFSAQTVTVLAKRASYVCSKPDCHALTIAAADSDLSSVLYIGKAAHICAAPCNGPRYDPAMTSDQRSDIANAIFLCSSCADLIDKNGGKDFSIAKLRDWKVQHEAWVRANLNCRVDSPLAVVDGTHQAKGVGSVTGLDIQGPVRIKPGTIVQASGVGTVTGTRIGGGRKDK